VPFRYNCSRNKQPWTFFSLYGHVRTYIHVCFFPIKHLAEKRLGSFVYNNTQIEYSRFCTLFLLLWNQLNFMCRGNLCLYYFVYYFVYDFNDMKSVRERVMFDACSLALLYIYIMSPSELRREGSWVLRAVISARFEKLHRNPRMARGGPLFGEVIPVTRNNLASAEVYYYGHSPGQFIPGSF